MVNKTEIVFVRPLRTAQLVHAIRKKTSYDFGEHNKKGNISIRQFSISKSSMEAAAAINFSQQNVIIIENRSCIYYFNFNW